MGILNVTPDSFADGGRYVERERALAHAGQMRDDGADLVTADRDVTIVDDGTPPPSGPTVSTRVGLSAGADLPWRWCTPGSPHLSKPA